MRKAGLSYKSIYNQLWKTYRNQVRTIEKQGYELPNVYIRAKNKKPDKRAVEGLHKLIQSRKVLTEAFTVTNGVKETRKKAQVRQARERREKKKQPKVVSVEMTEEIKHTNPDVKALWMRLNKSMKQIASLDHMSMAWVRDVFGEVERWWHTHTDEEILETIRSKAIDWDAFDIVPISSDGVTYYEFLDKLESIEIPKLIGYQPKVTKSDIDRLSPEQAALYRGFTDGTDEMV